MVKTQSFDTLVTWSDAISVDNKVIDDDHKKLIDAVNALYAAIHSGGEKLIVVDAFDEMMAYTSYHFGHEEKLMAKAKYPDIDDHARQHRGFIEQLGTLYGDFKNGKDVAGRALLNFLKFWLTTHIMVIDKRLAHYLSSH